MTSSDYYITQFAMFIAGFGIGLLVGDIIDKYQNKKNHGLTPKERFIKK